MLTEIVLTSERSDAELVAESLEGNRGAFQEIVERYKTLISSIAYGGTGNVGRSEDVAQETFIAAWTQLRSLREPDKLRGWLCGIVRNRIHRDRRVEQREPVRDAMPVEHAYSLPALELTPSEQAVLRDEEALLWRALEKIPPLYREPLILFYREHQSIEHVAAGLELSEDAVKQRLSRGRKLLQDEVQSFVQETLQRTAPGHAFSGAVVAMLPLAAGPAVGVAGMGLSANGSAMAAKSGFFASLLVPLAPFIGIAAGLGAHWLIVRETTTDRKVRSKKLGQVIAGWILFLGLAVGGEATVRAFGRTFGWDDRVRFLAVALFWWCFITGTVTFQMIAVRRAQAFRERCPPGRDPGTEFVTSMRPTLRAMAVAGAHLAMFAWLIALAWRHHDTVGVAASAGTMLVLGVWAFFHGRRDRTGTLLQMLSARLAIAAAVILLIVNLRAGVWVASAYGMTISDANTMLPLWIIPMLTAALMIWIALVLAVVRARRARI